jgi:hypothetical protein
MAPLPIVATAEIASGESVHTAKPAATVPVQITVCSAVFLRADLWLLTQLVLPSI